MKTYEQKLTEALANIDEQPAIMIIAYLQEDGTATSICKGPQKYVVDLLKQVHKKQKRKLN